MLVFELAEAEGSGALVVRATLDGEPLVVDGLLERETPAREFERRVLGLACVADAPA